MGEVWCAGYTEIFAGGPKASRSFVPAAPMPPQVQASSAAQMPPTSQLSTRAGSHCQRSGPAGPGYSSDDSGYFVCTRTDSCRFEHFDFAIMQRHEQQCRIISTEPAARLTARPAVVPAYPALPTPLLRTDSFAGPTMQRVYVLCCRLA